MLLLIQCMHAMRTGNSALGLLFRLRVIGLGSGLRLALALLLPVDEGGRKSWGPI